MSRRERAEAGMREQLSRRTMAKEIRFRNKAQEAFYSKMCDKPLVFASGPAGTGKTFLACARAVELWARGDVERIYLVRPAVESEENLGFLPGDVEEKMDPFLTPLYENLASACRDFERIEREVEVAPLAYMRGRTFNNCVVLVDEAQNMTPDQMLMLLTRLGTKCHCFVMGDPDQHDLIAVKSGLDVAIAKLAGCSELVAVHEFGVQDVVRSRLVQAVYQYWFAEDEPSNQ